METKLARLLKGELPVLEQRNETGYLFLDRNAKVFEMLIEWIRSDGEYFPHNSERSALLDLELKYWGFTGLDGEREAILKSLDQ